MVKWGRLLNNCTVDRFLSMVSHSIVSVILAQPWSENIKLKIPGEKAFINFKLYTLLTSMMKPFTIQSAKQDMNSPYAQHICAVHTPFANHFVAVLGTILQCMCASNAHREGVHGRLSTSQCLTHSLHPSHHVGIALSHITTRDK